MRGFAAQHLLPRECHDIELVPGQLHRKGGRGRVADGQAFTGIGNPVAIRHFHAAGGAVPHKHRVMGGIVLRHVRQLAVGRLEGARILDLELLDRVGHPVFGKAFPGEQVDGARTQQRPQRHFHRAGIRCRDDAAAIAFGKVEQLLGAVDRIRKLGFAGFGAVGASHQRALQGFMRPSRPLGAGSGRKKRPRRTHSRTNNFSHRGSFLPE